MIRLHQDAVKFYQRVLTTTNAGQRGLKYARKRGLSDELLEHFQIGYAPRQDNLLLMYLQQKNILRKTLLKVVYLLKARMGGCLTVFVTV